MDTHEGNVVLITGAASGFGAILASRLSSLGAKLVLSDINEDGLQVVTSSLDTASMYRVCDVSNEDQVAQLMDEAVETFGSIHCAINNAGISPQLKSLQDTTVEDLDKQYAINTKGVFLGMKYQAPVMIENGGGSILNVASVAGVAGAPKLASYCAAKHAVVGLTKTAAAELARHNVRVNAICPFFSPTPMISRHNNAAMEEAWASATPMKRLGAPEEMVGAMLSIIDPGNTYMTGQAISVDGGLSAL